MVNLPSRTPASGEEGQAITEYIVLIATVVSFYLILIGFINRYGLANKLAAPIKNDFARAYQYGSPKAYGFEDGGPKDHPRIRASGNFRIFINPVSGSGGG